MALIFVNLTKHPLLSEQEQWVAENCYATVEIDDDIRSALNFQELPTLEELEKRADCIADKFRMDNPDYQIMAMIGDVPFFTSTLERKLKEVGTLVVYPFLTTVSVEERGGIVKTHYKHEGWVEV